MRLIDADALKKAMDGYWGRCQRIRKPRNGETAVFLDVMATVEKQPTIDAVPVRYGKWLPIIEVNEYGEPYQSGVYCSECGETSIYEPNYCPNCGARMDAK